MFPDAKARTRTSVLTPFTMTKEDKKKCAYVSDFIILECIAVAIGAFSVLFCVWSPEDSTNDYGKLVRIMYLYDSKGCGYNFAPTQKITDLHLSNETHRMNVLPIKWLPAITPVTTRLSAKFRDNVIKSLILHVIWFTLSITFQIVILNSSDYRTSKFTLAVFFYGCVFMMCFDTTMAIIYITHIKQSLTKGMVLRYSGWSNELKLQSYDDFAGWLPIAASACWLRGVVFYIMNLYFCRILSLIRQKVVRREIFKEKLSSEQYDPIPEPTQVETSTCNVLVYRIGETRPQV